MPEIQARLGGEVLGEGHGYDVGIGAGEDGDSGGITTPSIKKPEPPPGLLSSPNTLPYAIKWGRA